MRGVSTILSTVVVVSIIVASSIATVGVVKPMIEKGKETAALQKAKNILLEMDQIIKNLIYQSVGSRKILSVSIPKGEIIVSGAEDKIEFNMYPKIKIMESGVSKREGSLLISYGPQVKSYETDIDNDGNTDLVIENSAVLFAVKKFYSSSSPGFINMSSDSVISLIKDKLTNTTITPTFKVSFNDDVNTTFGYGYTELLTSGSSSEGTIKLHLHCPSSMRNLTYDVFFTLKGGQDFVRLHVKKI